MSLIVRNDEQIKVGVTPGLVAGLSSFTFDGSEVSSGVFKPDYRGYEITISELTGRGILYKGDDFTWNSVTGQFSLLAAGDIFPADQRFNVHFDTVTRVTDSDTLFLINTSFFVRGINLVNTGKAPVEEKINSYIRQYEPVCLRLILGNELYGLVLTESSPRMTDLLYGTTYVNAQGFLSYWQGIVHDTDISLIANFVYYHIQEDSTKTTTGSGTKVAKQEGGQEVNPGDKMLKAWNFFSSEVESMCAFLWLQKDIYGVRMYPEFTQYHFCNTRVKTKKMNMFGI